MAATNPSETSPADIGRADERAAGSPASTRTAYRTCPLCEATCGLEVTVRRDADGSESVQRIRGDMNDVFSKGFICPKGSTLKQLHEDPDRLRVPLIKRDGVHVEATWADAWAAIEQGLGGVAERFGSCAGAWRWWLRS